MDGPRILVTGSGRSLAGRLISRLHAQGWNVRVFLGSAFSLDLTRSFETVIGSLSDPQSIVNALENVEAVIHFEDLEHHYDLEEFKRVNVDQTRNLVEACRTAGVSRLIHLSSVAVGYRRRSFYSKTRKVAEDVVRGSKLDWTIVRLPLVVGPHGEKSYRLLRRWILRYPILPLPDGGRAAKRPVHEDDALDGLSRILEVPTEVTSHKLYFLGGAQILTVKELVQAMARDFNIRTPWILPIPARFAEWISHWRQGKRPGVRGLSEVVIALLEDSDGDLAPAIKDLGYCPGSVIGRFSSSRATAAIPVVTQEAL